MPSNSTYTCIACRFSAKQTTKCPYCSKAMICMGKAFKPPRKTNNSQWQKVSAMVEQDLRFGYCSCHSGLRKIKSLSDAKALIGSRRVAKRNYASIEDTKSAQIARRKQWKAKLYDR